MQLVNIGHVGRTIYLFLRDNEGKLSIQKDDSFFPYYYEQSDEGEYKGFNGTQLKKILCTLPSDIKNQMSNDAWEADIKYQKRYLIDKVPQLNKVPIKYAFIDIEILANELPDVRNAKFPVSLITIYNSFSQEKKTFILNEYACEFDMIEAFINYFKKEQFDIWFSWNVKFDYNYLHNRFDDFAKKISPINVNRYGEEDIWYPVGVSIVDYLTLFKKFTLNKADNYTLDGVAQQYLGKGKTHSKVDFSVISQQLIERNKEDVDILVNLEKKNKIIPYYDEIRRLSKTEWEDLHWNSRIIDMLLLQEAKKQKIVLPNKPREVEKEEFLGAYREAYILGASFGVGKVDLGCYSEDTEILSEDGWKIYSEVNIGDLVASFNIKNNKIEFEPLLYKHVYEVKNEEMYNLINNSFDQLLTWNHRVLYKQTSKSYRQQKNDTGSWRVQFAKDVPLHHSIFPLAGEIADNLDYPISDELLQIHAWIITEGWNRKQKESWSNGWSISQSWKNKDFCIEITDLFNKLNWKVTETRRNRIGKKHEEIEWLIPVNYSNNINLEENYKVIPLWMLKKLSLRQLNLLFITLMKGDGNKKSACYNAVDNLARDRFQHLCCLIGRASYKNNRKEVYCKEQRYVSIQNNGKNLSGKNKVKYTGKVWCPTVANSFVVMRRKGKAFISGNSAYPYAVIDFCLDSANVLPEEDFNSIKIGDSWFVQEPTALLPTVMKQLVDLKNKIKEELESLDLEDPNRKDIKVKYDAIKSIVNSGFGVCGNKYFRMYNHEVASSITYIVRDILHYVKEQMEILGYPILYVDTDSVFYQSEKNLTELLNNLVLQRVKEKYGKDYTNIKFAFEGIFESILILAKCRYIGNLKTHKGLEEEVKGVEAKRKDSTVYMKKFQKELINKILQKEEKAKILNWINEEIQNIKNQSLLDIAFPCKISKKVADYKNKPIFVRAVEETDGFDVKMGDKFYWIYVEPEFYTVAKEVTEYYQLVVGKREGTTKKEKLTAKKLAELVAQEGNIKELLKSGKVIELTRTQNIKKAKDVRAFNEETVANIINIDWKRILERNIYNKLETIFLAMGWEEDLKRIWPDYKPSKEEDEIGEDEDL